MLFFKTCACILKITRCSSFTKKESYVSFVSVREVAADPKWSPPHLSLLLSNQYWFTWSSLSLSPSHSPPAAAQICVRAKKKSVEHFFFKDRIVKSTGYLWVRYKYRQFCPLSRSETAERIICERRIFESAAAPPTPPTYVFMPPDSVSRVTSVAHHSSSPEGSEVQVVLGSRSSVVESQVTGGRGRWRCGGATASLCQSDQTCWHEREEEGAEAALREVEGDGGQQLEENRSVRSRWIEDGGWDEGQKVGEINGRGWRKRRGAGAHLLFIDSPVWGGGGWAAVGEQAHCRGLAALDHRWLCSHLCIVCVRLRPKRNTSNSCKVKFMIVFIVVFIVKRVECSQTQYRNSIYSSILSFTFLFFHSVFGKGSCKSRCITYHHWLHCSWFFSMEIIL